MEERSQKKIIVAMSGGVDSSVAAALLKKQGFDVFGIYMKLNDFSKESEKRVGQVAKILNIPFYVLDLRREFKKRVINYFIEGYKKGITPNPCVVCNKEIKFGLLMEKALSLGADYVATGHYAKKTYNLQLKTCNLLKGNDKEKDQSYFLWKLNQRQVRRILFPLGNYTKAKVGGLARKLKLPAFDAEESQEVCFIKNDINDFLKKYIKSKPGNIIENPAFASELRRGEPAFVSLKLRRGEGKILGKHDGLAFYTIGQRKGIRLSGGPYYVINKDIKNNNLIVSKNKRDLLKKELVVKDVNWISGNTPKLPLKVGVKIRYRHEAVPAILTCNLKLKTYNLRFVRPQRAITPGQSAVFYGGQELLGGGIIC